MTKLVLEEGKFYITRDGRKVGPMVEEKPRWSDWTWDVEDGDGDLSRMIWKDDGTADETIDADLIEEWKEEPVKKFNVGDKVRVLRQDGFFRTFFRSIDCVFEVVDGDDVIGDKAYCVGGNGDPYTQVVHEDDLAHYTNQESHQEDGEWGPWVFDHKGSLSPAAMVIEYADGGMYVRHKLKKPVPKKQIEVGGSYVTTSGGSVYTCIYIEGDKAWMTANSTGPAYVWNLDGKSLSLNATWDIDFSQDPDDQVPF